MHRTHFTSGPTSGILPKAAFAIGEESDGMKIEWLDFFLYDARETWNRGGDDVARGTDVAVDRQGACP